MSLSNAKNHLYTAKHNPISDAEKIKQLTDALSELVKVVEQQDLEIGRLKGKMRRGD